MLLVKLILLVVLLQLASWVWIVVLGSGWEQRGQFGDMFGAVNALFSGLAFAGLVYTVWFQGQQRTEDTFFRLLQMFRQNFELVAFRQAIYGQQRVIDEVNPREDKIFQGRKAFEMLIQDCLYLSQPYSEPLPETSVRGPRPFPQTPPISGLSKQQDGTLKTAVKISMSRSLDVLQAYISTLKALTHFAKLIESKDLYLGIVASHLSPEEKFVLVLYADASTDIKEICQALSLSVISLGPVSESLISQLHSGNFKLNY